MAQLNQKRVEHYARIMRAQARETTNTLKDVAESVAR